MQSFRWPCAATNVRGSRRIWWRGRPSQPSRSRSAWATRPSPQTPVVTGLYTVIFPTIIFALLGSSRLLVVGADSATAAILAAGLASLGIAGLTPNSAEWLAYCGAIALITGVMLLVARLLRLGFIGDFLSASVLIGFLTGVGVQVLTGQIPSMLGIPKGTGNWLEQQWHTLSSLGSTQWETFAFAAGTLIIIVGFKRFIPRVPGAIVAVVLSIAISAAVDASAHGVAVVGSVTGGFPPVGVPQDVSWSANIGGMSAIAFSCLVLIVAQSAATSRSFAMKHGDPVDVNRDILGLGGANLAAAFTGTFVVNGSPTKTQILDSRRARPRSRTSPCRRSCSSSSCSSPGCSRTCPRPPLARSCSSSAST